MAKEKGQSVDGPGSGYVQGAVEIALPQQASTATRGAEAMMRMMVLAGIDEHGAQPKGDA